MSSIFIWKSSSANTSKNTIRVYSGLNWCLEGNDINSFSYKIDEQMSFNTNNNTVLVRNIINMPTDWTGSNLIEISTLPYSVIKSDNYAKLEMIGNWMRCTINNPVQMTVATINNEYLNIINWINNSSKMVTNSYKKDNSTSISKKTVKPY